LESVDDREGGAGGPAFGSAGADGAGVRRVPLRTALASPQPSPPTTRSTSSRISPDLTSSFITLWSG
jgi:hypothetical protein